LRRAKPHERAALPAPAACALGYVLAPYGLRAYAFAFLFLAMRE
jgi:hypothetical protein